MIATLRRLRPGPPRAPRTLGPQKLGAIAQQFGPDELDRLKRLGPAVTMRLERNDQELAEEVFALICLGAGGGRRVDPRASRGDRGEVRVVIDLATELNAWLRSTDARTLMKDIVAEAVQLEIRNALEDELIDVERAAEMLDMTEGALRKAVERGQVPCQRVGKRLRFRRMDLLSNAARRASTSS